MKCADCPCEVENGKRIVVCHTAACCCEEVPVADGVRATKPDYRPEVAEALGVFFLVLGGGAAILVNDATGTLGSVGVSLVFAFLITVLIYALGHLCGAHFNPAITLAFAATGHFPWRRVPTYLAAQVVGAILGALALMGVFGDVAPTTTQLDLGMTPLQGAMVEALATFLLALVIIAVATDPRAAPGAAGLAIGLTVGLDALAAGALTGASMNPARSLGPALVAGSWSNLWLYTIAPTVGAIAAMATYEALRGGTRPTAQAPLGSLGPFSLRKGEA